MISTHRPDRLRSNEGSALVIVTLLLMVMSALGAAIGTSGRTELFVARNAVSLAQARGAAEAGLNHALDVMVAHLNQSANPSAAITTLLDAGGSLDGLPGGLPAPGQRVVLPGANGAAYEARVLDDDDPAVIGAAPSAAVLQAIGEPDGDPAIDQNNIVVVRAIGYASDNTSVIFEATIGDSSATLPALVVGGNLTISGNPDILGSSAGAHANGHMTVSGSPYIAGDAHASGTFTTSGSPTIDGTSGGGRPPVAIPHISAGNHLSVAQFILTSAGHMVDAATGTVLCTASSTTACNNWRFESGGWRISGNSATNGTYYVEGNATISGNPGTPNNPVAMTIIAEGSIDISGNPDLIPHHPELMFVTNGDLRISGRTEVPLTVEGLVLVHEQLHISGNPTISGQVIVEDAAHNSNLVTSNQISGNPTISYNGMVSANVTVFSMSAWRQVR